MSFFKHGRDGIELWTSIATIDSGTFRQASKAGRAERGYIWQSRWGEDGKGQRGDPGSSPAWRRCQPPFQHKQQLQRDNMEEGLARPFKDRGNSTLATHLEEGGLTCQCKQDHVLARDSTYGWRETAQLGRSHGERDNSLGGDYVGRGKREWNCCAWRRSSSTLFVVDIGGTPAWPWFKSSDSNL